MKRIILFLVVVLILSGCTANQGVKNDSKVDAYEVDIVVIGAGGAGMAAAIEAKDAGANVLVLEKMSYIGGNTLRSEGGLNAANTKFQKEMNIIDSTEQMIEDTMKGGKDLSNHELVKFLAENSSKTIDWLTSIGMDVSDVGQGAGATNARMHRPKDGSKIGGVLVPKLLDNLNSRNIQVLLDTKAEALLTDDKGVITGVVAVNDKGESITINANAVIIATGGFGANEEVYVKYREDLKGFSTTNHPGATGDGILMAQAVNADTVDMDKIQTNPTVEVTTNTVISETVRGKGAILVNQEGIRFVSEMQTRDVLSSAILGETGKVAYLIFDERVMNSMAALKSNYEKGIIYKGETIEDLAKQLSIDSNALMTTLSGWNETVKSKVDSEFKRETGMDEDLSKAPYYAVKVTPAVHYTMGGIKVNTLTEVIDTGDKTIVGLYAAGEVTGGLHGGNRLGGNAVADIMVFGRQAGIQAAKYNSTQPTKGLNIPKITDVEIVGKGNYTDGQYEGIGKGLNGEIKLSVKVENNNIVEIVVVDHKDTNDIFMGAFNKISNKIIKMQTIESDTVTGATISSKGIIEAITNALK